MPEAESTHAAAERIEATPRRITRSGISVRALAWARDGSSVVFTSPQGEVISYVWGVEIAGGRSPERLELAGSVVHWLLLSFYSTPLGQKLSRVTPELILEVDQLGKKLARDMEPKVKQRVKSRLRKEGFEVDF
jgi:Uncharacterized protein conserved in bacteria (DUF2059)